MTRRTYHIVASFLFGATIAAIGCVPYYRPDLAAGHAEIIFKVASGLFMVGLLVAAAVSGSVHDVELNLAVVINCLLYGCVLFAVLQWRSRFRSR